MARLSRARRALEAARLAVTAAEQMILRSATASAEAGAFRDRTSSTVVRLIDKTDHLGEIEAARLEALAARWRDVAAQWATLARRASDGGPELRQKAAIALTLAHAIDRAARARRDAGS